MLFSSNFIFLSFDLKNVLLSFLIPKRPFLFSGILNTSLQFLFMATRSVCGFGQFPSVCVLCLCSMCRVLRWWFDQPCAPAERATKACAVWGLHGACSLCFTGRQVPATWLGDSWLTFVSVPSVSTEKNPSSSYLWEVNPAAP